MTGPTAIQCGATTDPVTGALTRGELPAALADAVARAGRAGGSCSLFLFDVDHFKTVNDAYGHARGDAVLRVIAERTIDLVRGEDLLVRYGGDEFVLLLPGIGRAEAMRVASRVVDGVGRAPLPGSPPLSISISVGVATFPDDATSAGALLEVADRRNYQAKRRGRGRAVSDDLVTNGRLPSAVLLERDEALTTAQDFLVRLYARGRGALRVTGTRGAGRSRFLTEVANLATARGFDVRRVENGAAHPVPEPECGLDLNAGPSRSTRMLIVADSDQDRDVVEKAVCDLAVPHAGAERPGAGPADGLLANHPQGRVELIRDRRARFRVPR